MITALTDGSPDSSIDVGEHLVHGLPVDRETRCIHWHGPNDVVAIGFRCCGRLYPCYECHEAVADHAAQLWPRGERERRVILCGACATLLSITEYLPVDACPRCGAPFNPGCRLHHPLYFSELI